MKKLVKALKDIYDALDSIGDQLHAINLGISETNHRLNELQDTYVESKKVGK